MKTRILIAAICALTTLSAGSAFARAGVDIPRAQNTRLALHDTNGDGMISREEMEVARQAEFDAGDTSGDGYLSLDEMSALGVAREEERVITLFNLIDADGNGVIDGDEMLSASPNGNVEAVNVQFDVFSGADGLMDLDEFTYMHSPEADEVRRFVGMDQDGDGLISSDEFGALRGGLGGQNGGQGQGPIGGQGQFPNGGQGPTGGQGQGPNR